MSSSRLCKFSCLWFVYKRPGAIRNGIIHRCSAIINGDTTLSSLLYQCKRKLSSSISSSQTFMSALKRCYTQFSVRSRPKF